jgi:hypothetical protein
MRASGSFTVKLQPQTVPGIPADPVLGQMSLDKQFQGDLAGASSGTMITGGNYRSGSAAYSAIEHVRGTLHGRQGSFLLQHTGVMDKGVPSLAVTVVPDSGQDDLAGLTGTMTIRIEAGGAHFYDFDYTLPG